MGWREHIGNLKSQGYTQYTQNTQKPPLALPFEDIEDIEDKGQKLKTEVEPPLQDDAEEVYRFEERAAILEFDGGLPKVEAERLSRSVWCHRRKPARWVSLAVCEWHKAEGDPVCQGCQPGTLKQKGASYVDSREN